MATPSQIRERLVALLAPTGLTVVDYPPESSPSVLPALVIGEGTAQLAEGDSALGNDRWEYPLVVLVSSGDYQTALLLLDSYLTRRGDKSVRQIIADNPTLGLLDGTTAHFARIEEHGPREQADGQRTAGAVLVLIVRTAS
jgi:hypothetical protein